MRTIQRDGVPNSVIGRAMALLTCFTPDDAELTLGEISRRTSVPKATVHRLVRELAAWRVVEVTERGVRLGPRLFELGQSVPGRRGLREAARPFLEDLYEATRETVHLAVSDGIEVVYVEKIPSRDGPELPSRVGGRMPAYCTAVGKAVLAHSSASLVHEALSGPLPRRTPYTVVMPGLLTKELEAVREHGVAYEREESTRGIVCVACPVLDSGGRAVAAVSIAGRPTRLDVARCAPAVRTAALGLSRRLRASG